MIADNRKKRKMLKTFLETKSSKYDFSPNKTKQMKKLASVELMCKITNPHSHHTLLLTPY